jgi:methionine-rich copper-binding protein CopC
MRKQLSSLPMALICLLAATNIFAQVSITSTTTPYTQNFNTLRATSGTSSTLPTGWKLLETGSSANTTYASDAGGTATGNTYSYGTGTATERAFGALRSGSLVPTLGVQIRNSTGSTITSLTISYTGEQWRCGTAGRTDQIDFQYSLNATSLSTGTWTDNNTLDFASPSTTSTGAKDGNAAANRSLKSTVITGLSIANNALFWLRWNDLDASGADDGLGIDDFSIQLNGTDVTAPTVSTYNPANGATAVALNGNLVLTFNENIQKGTTGNIVVKRTSDNVAVQTTAVTDAAVTVSSATATIPFISLAYSTGYYVNIDAGAFKDIAGNNYAGITATTTWAFTTTAAPSATVTVNPASLAFGFVAAGSTSAAQTFTYTTTGLTSSLTLTAPASFEVSGDGAAFASTVNYTLAEAQAGQTVYVRFVPSAANTTYSGLINFSSTGLNDNKVNLSGNSNVTGGGPLNFYFGNLHAHSSYSDGNADNTTKIPSDDYTYAKTALCMDFLGISEHNHATAGMSINDWQPGRNQAAAATTSTFVGLYGMEWGVISGGGHVIVYGMDSLVGWEAGNYQVFVTKNVYRGAGGLFDVLNRHGGNALAYLAHPNSTDYNNVLGSTFDVDADNAIVGSTVESGPAFSTNTSYTNPGTSMSYLSYYKNMLAKGYHLGPTIDHDNHNMTFGHTAKTRLVVMAPSLTENDLLQGMRNMRFYASQDCGAKITYTLNTQPIGSILTQAGAPVIDVNSITTSAVSSVVIMYGVPGSGTAATQLTSSASGTFTYTDISLANGGQRYYYLDITEADGSRIVTSPIWYTRNDAARGSSSLTSFFTVNEPDRVILKWTTANEEYNQQFEVQRSVDGGKNYNTLGLVNGRGFSMNVQTYSLTDMQPYAGVAYYRLVQRNSNGQIRFTDVKVVNRSIAPVTYYTVYPNPVHGILNINVSAYVAERTIVEVLDMNGRRTLAQPFTVIAGEQTLPLDMSRLGNGTYILKMTLGGKTSTQLVNKF